jgi:apolipoprotein N-acyltransferase
VRTTTTTSARAVLSLVLGVAAVACCGPFTGIPAAIVGKMELDAIKQGRSPSSNQGMAKAGFLIGIIATLLYILLFAMALVFGLLPILIETFRSSHF